MSFNALVLAGSRGTADPVAVHAGVSDKALIEIDGRTMLARVADALGAAGAARIIASVSSDAVADHARSIGIEVRRAAPGPSRSVAEALDAIGTPLLVTTADHALLRPEWVTNFLADAPADADVAVLLARRETIDADVPGTTRTYLRFADGDWSGCNLFHFASPRAVAATRLWQQVEADRKRPWRIVRRLGPGLLLRYLIRRLTLGEAVAHLGRVAGIEAAIVAARAGAAAVDVDKPADLALVRRLIADQSDRAPFA